MHRFTLLAAALIVLSAGTAEARSPSPQRSSASRQAATVPQAGRLASRRPEARAERAPQGQPCRARATVSMYYSTGRAAPRIRTGWEAAGPAPSLRISGPACAAGGNARWT